MRRKLAAATTIEQKLDIILVNIHEGSHVSENLYWLSMKAKEFRKLCDTTYGAYKEELLEYMLQYFPKHSRDAECFNIVLDDAYTFLFDRSVQSLRNDINAVKEIETFAIYTRFAPQATRVMDDFKQIKVEDLQDKSDTWYALATLVSGFDPQSARLWIVLYYINNPDLTKRYLDLLSHNHPGDDIETIVSEIITEHYQNTGELLEPITKLIADGYDCDITAQTLKLTSCDENQVEHYWRRLEIENSRTWVSIEAIKHLHSLYFTAYNQRALEILCKTLGDEKRDIDDVMKSLVEYEVEQDHVPLYFIVASLPYFHILQNKKYGEIVAQTIKTLFKEHQSDEDWKTLCTRVFKDKIAGSILSEEYIFGTILPMLKDRMPKRNAVCVFKSVAIYCANSIELRARFVDEYKQCLEEIFEKYFSLDLVEHGYTEFITLCAILDARIGEEWMDNLYAMNVLLDYCVVRAIYPQWLYDLSITDYVLFPYTPELRRVMLKVRLLTNNTYLIS